MRERDPFGVERRTSYTEAGFVDAVELHSASALVERYAYSGYDALGNPGQIVSGEGTTAVQYDARSRVEKVAYPGGSLAAWWDPTGRDPGMRRASILPIWRWDPVAELSIADSATYQRSEAQSQAEFSLATLDLFAGAAELATHYPESHGTATYQRTLPVARAARALGVFGVGFSGALLMQSMESGDEYAIAANSIGLGLNAATVAYPILLPADALFFAVDSSVGVDRMLRLEADLQLQRSRAITTGPTPIDVIVGLFE